MEEGRETAAAPDMATAAREAVAAADVVAAAREALRRAAELATFTEEPGEITRPLASPSLAAAMDRVREWMEAAGMTTRSDALGNLVGRREASGAAAGRGGNGRAASAGAVAGRD